MLKLTPRHNYTTQWTHSSPIRVDLCSLAIDVCEFAMQHCFKNVRVSKTIQVLIDVPAAREDGTVTLGFCTNVVSEGLIPGMVTITVNPNQTHEDFVNTLLHEMIHAQQILEGRLSASRIKNGENAVITLWNKRAFSTRVMEYANYPWEIEANYEANRLQDLMRPENAIVKAIAMMSDENEVAA